MEGKEESIVVSGWVDPKDLNSRREVTFAKLADAKFVFRSVLQPTDPVLTAEDLEQIVEELAAEAPVVAEGGSETGAPRPAETAAGTPRPAEAAAPSAKGTESASSEPTYRLILQKKKELFLIYVNRMADLLFR